MTDKVAQQVDLDRVLAVADQVSGARDKSLLWLRQPLKEFNGQSPEILVAMGRTDDVIDYLNSISSGFVG